MAEFPCDWHHERYSGVSTRLFLNLYRNDDKAVFRASVCEQCLATLLEEWLRLALHHDPRGFWMIPTGDETLEDLWEARSGPAEPMNGRRRA